MTASLLFHKGHECVRASISREDRRRVAEVRCRSINSRSADLLSMKIGSLPEMKSKPRTPQTRLRLLPLVVLALLTLASWTTVSAADKKVLFLYADKSNGVMMSYREILQSEMKAGSPDRITFYEEYMDLSTYPGEDYTALIRDFYRQKYHGQKFDLIFAQAASVLNFLTKYGEELFPGAPIVFGTLDKSRIEGQHLGPNITGVLGDVDFGTTLEAALRLQPDVRNVVVVSGASELDRIYLTKARTQFRGFEGRVDFTYLTDLPIEELEQRLANIPDHTITFYTTLFRDGAGHAFALMDSLARVAKASRVPTYIVAADRLIEAGSVGGFVFSTEADAKEVAKVALRVLAGEKPADIPIHVGDSNRYMFDWRQLRRWRIDERRLPPGSILRFQELSFWSQYKWRIVAITLLFLIEALLIVLLLINRKRIRRTEAAKAKLAAIVESSDDAILSKTLDGMITSWNAGAEKMYGYSASEMQGRHVAILAPPDRKVEVTGILKQIRRGESIDHLETVRITRDGRRIDVSLTISPIRDEDGLIIGASTIARDITDRTHAEEVLRQSEERFRNLADNAPVMIWIAGTDKLCTYFNKQWLDFTGRRLEDELGNGWAAGVYTEDCARCLETYTSAFDRREPFRMEYRLRRSDGSFRWVYDIGTPRVTSNGEFLGFIGSCIDIHDRKAAENYLQQAHQELSRLKDQLHAENIYLQEEIQLEHGFPEMIGESKEIKYVFFKINQVAPTDSTVLILGETGTGKELVARAIHGASARKDRPLVKINCAALPASLIESELFGHEKGAFTGAQARKIGRFEIANGATLFLDEIGELPLELQPKLLRVLQEGEFERLGSAQTIKVDVRIITATNRDLKAEVQKGLFREDLWYRLNVFPITVLPLRQRDRDIPLLVNFFVEKFNRKLGKFVKSISPNTLKALQNHTWPGNVRELANVIERAIISSQGNVLRLAERLDGGEMGNSHSLDLKSLEDVERHHILTVLEECHWRIQGLGGAADILKMNSSTLRTRMAKLGISKPTTKSTASYQANSTE